MGPEDRPTPGNSATFASTGGNGVHFGILHDPTAGGTAPIVMMVPMASDPLPSRAASAAVMTSRTVGVRAGRLLLSARSVRRQRGRGLLRWTSHSLNLAVPNLNPSTRASWPRHHGLLIGRGESALASQRNPRTRRGLGDAGR